jgi:hypothetical protein
VEAAASVEAGKVVAEEEELVEEVVKDGVGWVVVATGVEVLVMAVVEEEAVVAKEAGKAAAEAEARAAVETVEVGSVRYRRRL